MRSFLKYEAVVAMDRNGALTAVADALGAAGGWIVDHTLFSDVMATIRFSLPGDRTGAFEAALADAGLTVDPAPGRSDAVELNGAITLTFTQGTGDLRRDVPAFS
ncbi:hypothetical protein J2848_001563 [Azospirillum lipoferum]|uniref:ACT domain-containing protein n=1 Tax=Azospirillum lipoferum TaxID=193 RepID=A0A5A9GU93_AZOLI|nr:MULTISPECIES: hypothetical protein [Azospirillum]KAA0597950.1 hypothetical protein FZ942_02315 [Azospirillum lipoferum]MCP1609904.1 hypothetical protein [Azospirillum lipoferum]MDW5534603.1 hypothetical protein [Azospirillum sp. NL1]